LLKSGLLVDVVGLREGWREGGRARGREGGREGTYLFCCPQAIYERLVGGEESDALLVGHHGQLEGGREGGREGGKEGGLSEENSGEKSEGEGREGGSREWAD